MILVLLGTQNNSFHRLLEEIDLCISSKLINTSVLVQSGYTNYFSNQMIIFDFIPKQEMKNLINSADFIITHGGVASIVSSIKSNKKVIAVPRLKQYDEHVNDHQVQIVNCFNKKNYIKGILNVSELKNVISTLDDFTPTPYVSQTNKISSYISNYIENN